MNNSYIIIINGSGGCGKSEFIKQCKVYCDNVFNGLYEVHELSSVDYVKEIAGYCGWLGTKTDKDRRFLYELKVALENWNDSPNQKVFAKISNCIEDGNHIFFVNIREIRNIVKFKLQAKEKYNFPCYDLLVTNKNVPRVLTNPADARVNFHEYDFYIHNDGDLENLKIEAKNFINNLINN